MNQLQYIDSNTPEHTVPSSATGPGHNNGSHAIFTSVQIHEEPVQFERREKTEVAKESGPFERYSYPYYGVVQREMTTSGGQSERYSLPAATMMTVDDEHSNEITVSGCSLNK